MRDEHSLDPFLADLLTELRSWGAGEAPVASQALATLLDGADQVDLAPPPFRRKKMLVAKLAGLGVFAKVALGVGVAAAAVTTAGATGVLPDAAQHGVAIVVNAVSPIEIPDVPVSVGVRAVGADVNLDVDVTIPTTTVTLPGAGVDPSGDDAPANHGACVSAIAKDKTLTGREHGQAVAAIAQSDCGKEDGSTTSTTTPGSTTTTSTTVPGGEETTNRASNGSSGPGNSGGHANPNADGKGSGKN